MYKLIENRQVTCRLRDLYLVLPDGIDAAVLNRIVIIHLFHPESFAEQEGTFVIS